VWETSVLVGCGVSVDPCASLVLVVLDSIADFGCAFSIFALIEIVQVFPLAVNARYRPKPQLTPLDRISWVALRTQTEI
jgi:hypothetical protein